jgi:nitroreductase
VNATAFDDLIRTRRTHKAFGPDPVPDEVLLELFELARWAPNHHVTDPWRFRVLGRNAREALKRVAEEAKAGSGSKLDRAPTLIAASAKQTGDAAQDQEDVLATAVASYIVLLGAHARGLAGYWRTVPVMETAAGRAALGLPGDELPIGLLHLGDPRQEQRVPERAPVEEFAFFLE